MSCGASVRVVSFLTAILFSTTIVAQGITLPAGTGVYGELNQTVISKKKKFAEGDLVRASAWRNVVVDGRTIIKAGSPMIVRISHLKKAKIAGVKGGLELEAVSVRAVDGADILLDGGYDKSGKGRKALSISLGLLLLWPLLFMKGKAAKLEAGTVFDGFVQADTTIHISGSNTPRNIRIASGPELEIEVLYDDMDPEGKDKHLPLTLRLCGSSIEEAAVVTVNGEDVKGIPVEIQSRQTEANCELVIGKLSLEKLAKLLRKGINRFEIEANGTRAEVILDVEL